MFFFFSFWKFSTVIVFYNEVCHDAIESQNNQIIRGGSRTAATSKMEHLVIIVNGFQLLLFEVNFEKWKRKFYEGRLLKDSTKVFFSTLKISFSDFSKFCLPFHDGGWYHIETCPLICSANQWTGFYMISASVLKGLNRNISIKKR